MIFVWSTVTFEAMNTKDNFYILNDYYLISKWLKFFYE